MKRLMLDHAFRFVDRVVFLVGPQNLRSQRAVEKIGGVRMGSRSDAGGRESIVYEITATAYGLDSRETLPRPSRGRARRKSPGYAEPDR
jgi:hypothetical protein